MIISKLRQTRSGELLIEINGDSNSAELVRAEVKRTLGPGSLVRKIKNSTEVELRDIDCMAITEEILDAISREIGTDPTGARVATLRKASGDTQTVFDTVKFSVRFNFFERFSRTC